MPIIAADCGGTNLAVMRLERAGDPGEPLVAPTPTRVADIPGAIATMAGRLGGGNAVGVAIAGLVAGGDLLWMPHRDG